MPTYNTTVMLMTPYTVKVENARDQVEAHEIAAKMAAAGLVKPSAPPVYYTWEAVEMTEEGNDRPE